MMDLAALAAICDANRVIFMKMPASYMFKFLGLNTETAGLSHRIGNAGMGGTCVANAIDMIHTIDNWYAQQFAYLVGRLDSIDGRRPEAARQHRDRLVPGDVGRQRPQPQQPADPPGGELRRLLQGRLRP